MGIARPNDGLVSPEERQARRERVRGSQVQIIGAYRDGVSMRDLSVEFGVSTDFLNRRFDEWDEPRRGKSEAAKFRKTNLRPGG